MTDKPKDYGATDKAKGHANEAVGTIKEKIGGLIGDHELEAKGDAQNAKGKAQRAKGEVTEVIDKTVDKVKGGVEAIKEKLKGE